MFMVCFGVSSKLWCDNFAKKNNISNFTPSKFLEFVQAFCLWPSEATSHTVVANLVFLASDRSRK